MAGRLVLLGILQTTIQYIFFYIGLANTTGAKSAIINSLTAFFPIVLAPLFFRDDRLTVKKGLGCLIGLAGIVIINLDGSGLGGFKLTGEGFAVFAAMAQSLASIYSKKLARYMNVMTITGYQLLLEEFFWQRQGSDRRNTYSCMAGSTAASLYGGFVGGSFYRMDLSPVS